VVRMEWSEARSPKAVKCRATSWVIGESSESLCDIMRVHQQPRQIREIAKTDGEEEAGYGDVQFAAPTGTGTAQALRSGFATAADDAREKP